MPRLGSARLAPAHRRAAWPTKWTLTCLSSSSTTSSSTALTTWDRPSSRPALTPRGRRAPTRMRRSTRHTLPVVVMHLYPPRLCSASRSLVPLVAESRMCATPWPAQPSLIPMPWTSTRPNRAVMQTSRMRAWASPTFCPALDRSRSHSRSRAHTRARTCTHAKHVVHASASSQLWLAHISLLSAASSSRSTTPGSSGVPPALRPAPGHGPWPCVGPRTHLRAAPVSHTHTVSTSRPKPSLWPAKAACPARRARSVRHQHHHRLHHQHRYPRLAPAPAPAPQLQLQLAQCTRRSHGQGSGLRLGAPFRALQQLPR